jgi:mRNA interferase MazF
VSGRVTPIRGQIWWADLGEPSGSEPGYRHPVLVIQREEVNRSRIGTVVVCVLTSNTRLAVAPGNTLLPRRQTGLRKDSVANASQILTLNKNDLEKLAGSLPRALQDKVDAGLRWFFDLEP